MDSLLASLGLTVDELLGVGTILLAAVLMVGFALLDRFRPVLALRKIPAFARLSRAIGLAVEDGTRLHVSVGRAKITDPTSASALVGLSMLGQIIRVAKESDNPPIATAGDGALAILSQDVIRRAYFDMDSENQFDLDSGRLAGLTPFGFAAGAALALREETVSATALAGSFGGESALIADAVERTGGFLLGGSENLAAQAVLFASAQEPLIGEELFAGGAYLNAGGLHKASLHTQDVIRWLLVLAILVGGLFKFLGS